MRWNKNGHRILTYVFFEDQNTIVICKDFKDYLEDIKQSIPSLEVINSEFHVSVGFSCMCHFSGTIKV